MKFVFFSLTFSLTFLLADLQSDIYIKAQRVCFLKYNGNGLQGTDYSPTVISQSLIYSDVINDNNDCTTWQNSPYTNIDSSTYSVVADMSCNITSEVFDGTTYYTRTIERYSLAIDCHYDANASSCVIPKDSNGLDYEKVSSISESLCTVSNLQQLHDSSSPTISYIIDDTKFLSCQDNDALIGCYYAKHIRIDNNSTDGNFTPPSSNSFDDSNIVGAIDKLRTMNDGDVDFDTSFFNTFSAYYSDLNSSFSVIKQSVDDALATMDGNYEPSFPVYNSCILNFKFYNKIKPFDLCQFSSSTRPFIVFILTIYFLVMLIRLHLYFLMKFFESTN